MSSDEANGVRFDDFVRLAEERLSFAFVASYGPDLGVEATAEALAYAWRALGAGEPDAEPDGLPVSSGQSKLRRYLAPICVEIVSALTTTPNHPVGFSDSTPGTPGKTPRKYPASSTFPGWLFAKEAALGHT